MRKQTVKIVPLDPIELIELLAEREARTLLAIDCENPIGEMKAWVDGLGEEKTDGLRFFAALVSREKERLENNLQKRLAS